MPEQDFMEKLRIERRGAIANYVSKLNAIGIPQNIVKADFKMTLTFDDGSVGEVSFNLVIAP